jgi:hypothetical protein
MYNNGVRSNVVRSKKVVFDNVAAVIKGAMEHFEPPLSIWQRIIKVINEKEEVSYRLLKT